LIFIDEANFISRALWTELILPLNLQEKTSLIAASSPKGSANTFASRLIEARSKVDGKLIFNVVRAVEVCKKCLQNGTPETCNHDPLSRSFNKSQRKAQDTMAIYGDGDDYDVGMEENLGIESKSKGGIIPNVMVEEFKENIAAFNMRPRCIYLSIDPGGGGKGSQIGVVIAAEMNTPSKGVVLTVRH
jgi:hypothetical protein